MSKAVSHDDRIYNFSPQIIFLHITPFVFFPIGDDFTKGYLEFFNGTRESNESRMSLIELEKIAYELYTPRKLLLWCQENW